MFFRGLHPYSASLMGTSTPLGCGPADPGRLSRRKRNPDRRLPYGTWAGKGSCHWIPIPRGGWRAMRCAALSVELPTYASREWSVIDIPLYARLQGSDRCVSNVKGQVAALGGEALVMRS